LLPLPGRCPPRIHRRAGDDGFMADFLVVVGIIAFVAAMLALIWGLERI
jgi:hypothetical protein